MKCKLIGFKSVNYEKNGVPVQGISLFMAQPDPEVVGQKCKEEYISNRSRFYSTLLPYLSGDVSDFIGSTIDIDYDFVGRGSNLRPVILDLQVISNGK